MKAKGQQGTNQRNQKQEWQHCQIQGKEVFKKWGKKKEKTQKTDF